MNSAHMRKPGHYYQDALVESKRLEVLQIRARRYMEKYGDRESAHKYHIETVRAKYNNLQDTTRT